jgi:hypothetical protein
MTAKILQFSTKDGKLPHHRDTDKKSIDFDSVYNDILDSWQQAARKNSLKTLIFLSLPETARPADHEDCVNDLNVISEIERKLELKILLFSPSEKSKTHPGWVAGFTIDGKKYLLPKGMVTEANARTLNVLLFVEFKRRLKLSTTI